MCAVALAVSLGLESVQFGEETCYSVVGNTDHEWLNETLFMSFATSSDIDTHQILWYEFPLIVAISKGFVEAIVYPGRDQGSVQLLSVTRLALVPDFHYR